MQSSCLLYASSLLQVLSYLRSVILQARLVKKRLSSPGASLRCSSPVRRRPHDLPPSLCIDRHRPARSQATTTPRCKPALRFPTPSPMCADTQTSYTQVRTHRQHREQVVRHDIHISRLRLAALSAPALPLLLVLIRASSCADECMKGDHPEKYARPLTNSRK